MRKNCDTQKISIRCHTRRPVASWGCFLSTAHRFVDLRQARNLPPDGKVTGKPQRGAAAHSQTHLPAQETEAEAHGRFLVFFFSSSLPSSSRRWLTTFPSDGVTFRSNITASTCAEHSVSFSFLLRCGMWPLPLCCVIVPWTVYWHRTCSHDGTERKCANLSDSWD